MFASLEVLAEKTSLVALDRYGTTRKSSLGQLARPRAVRVCSDDTRLALSICSEALWHAPNLKGDDDQC
jgi:hypothetical protein